MVETQSQNICDKIIQIIPKSLDNIFELPEKLEAIGLDAKFLNRESIDGVHSYYYYLINSKYILHLYYRDGELRYISIRVERPARREICERDLEHGV